MIKHEFYVENPCIYHGELSFVMRLNIHIHFNYTVVCFGITQFDQLLHKTTEPIFFKTFLQIIPHFKHELALGGLKYCRRQISY